jgi:MFS family permease
MGSHPRHRLLVVAAFALSGAGGLMLEVLWFRALGLGGGRIGTAAAAVTAAYMAGLAIGSRLGAFFADRVERRLWLYATMEALVAASALVVPLVLQHLVGAARGAPAVWLLIALVLLVPTTAIGTGLPLLTTCLTDTRDRAASTSGLLYGVNTAGAVLGVAWIGFVGLPYLGAELSSSVAAAGILLVAGAAAYAAWRVGPQPIVAALENATTGARPRRAVLGAAAVASGAAMLVQIAWTKIAAAFFDKPATGFSGVVLVFLAGLSFGGLFASRWVRRVTHVERALSLVLGATGLSVGLALLVGVNLAPAAGAFGELLVLLPLLPATICMGLLFPLFVSLCAKRGASIGASVGITSAASTVGAIAGSLVGATLLPTVGAYSSVCGGLAIYAFLSTAVRLRLS